MILIAGGDVDLASVGGGGGGERVRAADEGDGSRRSVTHVEDEYSGDSLGDDDDRGAIGYELRIERSEVALAEVEGLRYLGKITVGSSPRTEAEAGITR